MAIAQEFQVTSLAGSSAGNRSVSGFSVGMGIVAVAGIAGTASLFAGVLVDSAYTMVAGTILMLVCAGATYLTDRKRRSLVQ